MGRTGLFTAFRLSHQPRVKPLAVGFQPRSSIEAPEDVMEFAKASNTLDDVSADIEYSRCC
jgi:hypothetical protein